MILRSLPAMWASGIINRVRCLTMFDTRVVSVQLNEFRCAILLHRELNFLLLHHLTLPLDLLCCCCFTLLSFRFTFDFCLITRNPMKCYYCYYYFIIRCRWWWWWWFNGGYIWIVRKLQVKKNYTRMKKKKKTSWKKEDEETMKESLRPPEVLAMSVLIESKCLRLQ